MEITLLIMENHGIVFLNFCGNPVKSGMTEGYNGVFVTGLVLQYSEMSK